MKTERLYKDNDLCLSNLAAKAGLSPYQLSEILNVHLNKNFSAFINNYRIEAAIEMLGSYPEEKIIDIALEVGFNSVTTFNRVFKKETGDSPTVHRKKLQ